MRRARCSRRSTEIREGTATRARCCLLSAIRCSRRCCWPAVLAAATSATTGSVRRAHAVVRRRFPKPVAGLGGARGRRSRGRRALHGARSNWSRCCSACCLPTSGRVSFWRGFPTRVPGARRCSATCCRRWDTSAKPSSRAVPGLLFVALIFVITRIIARAVRAFFDGVQAGRIRVGLVDDTTARPTGRLLIAGIWLFALVAAYPYIPGSGSEAFKGIGVFVGLMLSLGASGVVNQAVSGLMLMYTRALRPGEFVQIGEYEGTVKSVGFVTTRIETLRREEINIPNAVDRDQRDAELFTSGCRRRVSGSRPR